MFVMNWFLAQTRCLWKLGIGIIIGILLHKWHIDNVWHLAGFKIKELVSWFGLFRCKLNYLLCIGMFGF